MKIICKPTKKNALYVIMKSVALSEEVWHRLYKTKQMNDVQQKLRTFNKYIKGREVHFMGIEFTENKMYLDMWSGDGSKTIDIRIAHQGDDDDLISDEQIISAMEFPSSDFIVFEYKLGRNYKKGELTVEEVRKEIGDKCPIAKYELTGSF